MAKIAANPPEPFRGKNFLHERFETRVAAKIVKHCIDLKQKDPGTFAVQSFQFIDRSLFVAQGQIHQRKTVCRDVAGLGLVG